MPNGYVSVSVPGRGTVLEHRLVMEQMLGRRLYPGEEVHHINRDRDDNRPDNLQLVDSAAEHRRLHFGPAKMRLGRRPRGSDFRSAKLTEQLVAALKARYRAGGLNRKQLAAEYGVSDVTVSNILNGKNWRHVA